MIEQMTLSGLEVSRVKRHCSRLDCVFFCESCSQSQVTIFFYNPNIHPRLEYDIRKNENKRYADALNIPFVDCDYDTKEWFKRAKGTNESERIGF